MNHKIKSLLIVLILIVMLAAIGLFVGQGGITGASTAHSVACFDNEDCNDKIEGTEDICKNPGTEFALCVNRPN